MFDLPKAIVTYAELKERIHLLTSEADRLRNLIVEADPTHGATHEAPPYKASVAFVMGPDRIDRAALYKVVSKTHLIQHNILIPGTSYWRLSVQRR